MRETKETIVDFMAFGDGRVKSKAMTASAATTYVSIIHCNAIFLSFFFLYSEDSFCVRFLLGFVLILYAFLNDQECDSVGRMRPGVAVLLEPRAMLSKPVGPGLILVPAPGLEQRHFPSLSIYTRIKIDFYFNIRIYLFSFYTTIFHKNLSILVLKFLFFIFYTPIFKKYLHQIIYFILHFNKILFFINFFITLSNHLSVCVYE